MNERERERDERAFDALFSQLPVEPVPAELRRDVMARITRERRGRSWQWVLVAVLALPNLAFLLWELTFRGGELALALASIGTALSGAEEVAPAVVYVDGLTILAIASLGLAGSIATHALLRNGHGRLTFGRA